MIETREETDLTKNIIKFLGWLDCFFHKPPRGFAALIWP